MKKPISFVVIASIAAGQATTVAPQRSQKVLKFEVATVRPPDDTAPLTFGSCRSRGGPGTSAPGQMTFDACSLFDAIRRAYGVLEDQVSGPSWLSDVRFTITAKVPERATKAEANEMLQSLLVERFGLSFHRVKKDFELYELTVAKGGPKLKPAANPYAPPYRGGAEFDPNGGFPRLPPGVAGGATGDSNGVLRSTFAAVPIATLIRPITQALERITGQTERIVDNTGLTGKYDFRIEYAVDEPGQDVGGGGPSLFSALQDQLGLQLRKTKVPMDVIVIDRIEKTPEEN
jgi:uncharacterized protein (TIGR03435 family)